MNSLENSTKLSNSSLNEEFWTELDSISESGHVSQAYNELDEESTPNKSFEDVAEADWLKEAGFEDFVDSLQGDSMTSDSTSLDDLLLSLPIPLTERQAKTVKKKFNTLRTTLNKQKGSKRGQEVVQITGNSKQRPDVRSLFNNSHNSSTQPINIPKTEVSEQDGNVCSAPKHNLEVPQVSDLSISRRSSSPDLQQMSRERTYSTPPDYGKLKVFDSDSDKTTNNLLKVSKSSSNVKKESSRFSWSGYKKAFKVNHDRRNSSSILDSETNDSGIEMLSLKYKSSLRRQEDLSSQSNSDKKSNQLSDLQINDHFISDHITAEGLGIVIEPNAQIINHTGLVTDLRLSSYVVRLESLSPEMNKKVRTLALIELATVLDMHGLEYEKIKRRKLRKKIRKNSDNGCVFGASLMDLYNTDRRRDNNCRIPSILRVLIDFIQNNGLHEEGIFRITGSQNRVQALKEELESLYHYCYNNSLRENNKEIFALLNKYSIYDICSVLKHFIRELPDPLLTCELLEAFLLVPKVNDFLQQIQILNLLILLMNDSHRNSLEAILTLLNVIITHELLNKMTVHNIATIMAPNLFPNLIQKKISKGGEHKEIASVLERAKDSFIVTKMLINCQSILFHVPPYLIGQIQRRRK